MKLRVVDFGSVPALQSHAAAYAIFDLLRPADDATLVLVDTTEPYVCLGYHQDVDLELDRQFCQSRGIRIIRRRLGGGAIYIDSKQMIFHFLHPADRVPKETGPLYAMFAEPVLRTYRDLGLSAVWRPPSDICIDGRKIGGMAAAAGEHAAMVAGTFLFDFDITVMTRCLKVPTEEFRAKLEASIDGGMTTMRKLLPEPPSRAAVRRRFIVHAGECLGMEPSETVASVAEQAAIAAEAEVLASAEWTFQRGRKFVAHGTKISAGSHLTERSFKTPSGLLRVRLLERDGRIAFLAIEGNWDPERRARLSLVCEKLLGRSVAESELAAAITDALVEFGLQLPGMSPASLATAILATCHRE